MTRPLLIIGAGGHGTVVLDAARVAGLTVLGALGGLARMAAGLSPIDEAGASAAPGEGGPRP